MRFINVPAYSEISVKHMYPKLMKLENMAKYFPDKYAKGNQCCQKYMYNVFNTLFPALCKEVIDFANANRYAITGEKIKEDCIVMTEDWEEELKALPFVSKEKGRMSALLKRKSKIFFLVYSFN